MVVLLAGLAMATERAQAAAAAKPGGTGTISGAVLMPDGVTPADGALVYFHTIVNGVAQVSGPVITDFNGGFEIELPAGRYGILAHRKLGQQTVRAVWRAIVNSNQNTDVLMRLDDLSVNTH